jgi:putative Holliday junction resolvase
MYYAISCASWHWTLGQKNIGVAVSDALLLTANGRPTLKRTSWEADVRQLRRLVEENEVDTIVVGKPLHMGGRKARKVRE